MKRARLESQLSLPPVALRNSEPSGSGFRNSEGSDLAVRTSESDLADVARPADDDEAIAAAAALFDEALKRSGLDNNKDVAALIGVSQSLVDKWRRPNEPASPSLVHMMKLPATFHWEFIRGLFRRYRLARLAAREIESASSVMALAAGE